MRRHFALVICLILSCKPASPGSDTSAARGQNPGSSKHQDDEQIIRDAEFRWRKTLTSRDAPQGSPAYRGRDSVSGRWSLEFRSPAFQLERTPLRIEVAKSGDLAHEVGTYQVRFRDQGQVRQGGGTYMTAWRKEGGEWRIASYMWNRNEPEGRR
jgi:hypothetical protein